MKIRQRVQSIQKRTRFALLTLILCASVDAVAQAPYAPVVPKTLSVGADLTYQPYEYYAGSTPAGVDPDFMDKLSSHMGLTSRFVDTRFVNLILGLNAGRYDIVASGLYVTPERAKQVDFIPYVKTGGSLLALRDSGYSPKVPADLCGKRVGSVKGGSWIPKLIDVSNKVCLTSARGAIDVHEFDTSPAAAQALLSRAVDAQFEDSAVAKMFVQMLGGRVAITSNTQIYPVVIGLAIKKGNDALMQNVQTAFAAMRRTGEYQEILKRYNLAEPGPDDLKHALEASSN